MIELHPEVIFEKGRKKSVILPYKEFVALQQRLADADDLLELRRAKRSERRKKFISLDEVKLRLN